MKFQSCITVGFTMQYMKKLWIFFINVRNVKYILSGTYFCHNSIKIENQAVSTKKMTKKEKLLNWNLEESSEMKSLVFPVSLYYWEMLKTSC